MGKKLLEKAKDIEITCGYGWYGLILSAMANVSFYGGKGGAKITRAGERGGHLELDIEGEISEILACKIRKLREESAYLCEFCGQRSITGREGIKI